MTAQIGVHSPLTATLSPLRRAVATRWSSGGRRVAGASRSRRRPGSGGRSTAGAAAELALDESESGLAVFLAVALVNVGVVAGAAVWVCAVAVALDLARGLVLMLDWLSFTRNHRTLTEQL